MKSQKNFECTSLVRAPAKYDVYLSTKTLNGQSDLKRIHIQRAPGKKEMDTSASEKMDLAFSLACTCEELWSRLVERYGKEEILHQSFTRRIESFSSPTYTDSHKWYELSDLLNEILALTEDKETTQRNSLNNENITSRISNLVQKLFL
ncbi:hypothetical protein DPMN_193576 [Dreissena polymorpha]|uniref:Uncharacterized protein n=1 Tax=Dreissena polymorpha TaxID=45954 RepID=A0A9D3Y151_DREPO|nr:hypothetical protein DPMN_193576 [Dreissena polymorpha]